jgi:hypothetical protein
MSGLAAGYYRYLAQAVGALPRDTPEARGVLYRQVREAVAHRLQTAQPPHSAAEIARHKTALERSIRFVELSAGYYPSLAKAVAAVVRDTPETLSVVSKLKASPGLRLPGAT